MNELNDYSMSKAYGQAVFDLAAESDMLDQSFEQLCFIQEVFKQNPDFENFLKAPFISFKKKADLVDTAFSNRLSQTILNFLHILIKNDRIAIFENIKDYFLKELDENKGLLHVQITVDRELDDQSRTELIEELRSATKKEIKLEKRIDPSLLGGIIINCQGRVVDNSVKGALKRAVKHIKGIK